MVENLILFQAKDEQFIKFWKPYRINESALILPIRINQNMIHALQISPLNIQEVGNSQNQGEQIHSIHEAQQTLQDLLLENNTTRGPLNQKIASYEKRTPVQKQLLSGHLRIDLCNPLAQSNFILLKGPSNSGKLGFTLDVVSNFIAQNENNLAIVVTLKTAKIADLSPHEQIVVIQPDDSQSGKSLLLFRQVRQINRTALEVAKAQRKDKNILLIFDSLVDHFLKEIEVYDEADLPFSHYNLVNQASTLTGQFQGQEGSLTTLGILDTDKVTIDLQLKLDRFTSSAESVSDHIVEFEPTRVELKSKRSVQFLESKPTLDTKPQQLFLHNSWINQNLRPLMRSLRELNSEVDRAYEQSIQRKNLKVAEDPWDNYLMHDSKYFIKLLAHPVSAVLEQNKMSLFQQILIAEFVLAAVQDESIAEYKEPAEIVMKRLIKFTRQAVSKKRQFSGYETEEGRTFQEGLVNERVRLQIPNLQILKKDLEVVFKMFHLSEKVEGRLREYKNDYFS